MIDEHDLLEIYCPQMGTMLTFNYCRRVQSDLPCRNFIHCWETRMEVGTLFERTLSPGGIAGSLWRASQKPNGKDLRLYRRNSKG